jgi:phospholipase/lecithinase/hemolysin
MKLTASQLARGLRSRLGLALATATLFLAQTASFANATAFSRIVVFGDSLSDTGNFYALSGGWPPSPPYTDGRFSNGRLWIEYLAEDLGMNLAAGDNHAVAGATTGTLNSNNQPGVSFPGLQQQIAAVLAGGALDPDALYVVWTGANDFFVTLETGGDPAAMIASGVGNTLNSIQSLWEAGARHIVVPNVPDLGLTPFAIGAGAGPLVTTLAAAYNNTLTYYLNQLAAAGISTIRVDAFSSLQRMVQFASDFGFANVTHPFLAVGGDPSTFLFWDIVHPTTGAHRILADDAGNALIDYYSPSSGKGAPKARLNLLKGLVNAGHPKK